MSPTASLEAGFSKENITPPIGTRMMGWRNRDEASGCKAIHDPLFVRALFLKQASENILVLAYDLCFIGRIDCDRLKSALGTGLNLQPRQILISSTHNHAGPAAWGYPAGVYDQPDSKYLDQLHAATLRAANAAKIAARPARLSAGTGKSTIPMNRRCNVNGAILNAPNPGGVINSVLPVCRFTDLQDHVIALVFSIATHPVVMRGWNISADYPGVAVDQLGTDSAMFLQGTGADSRPALLANGSEWNWDSGWKEALAIGQTLADEVRRVPLQSVQPQLGADLREMVWPLQNGGHCPVWLHGIQLGTDLRFVALEGEPVAAHGLAIQKFYPNGTTFALGYANGPAMYLVTSAMLDEGGYEPTSFGEYGFPAPLAKGMEHLLETGLQELKIK